MKFSDEAWALYSRQFGTIPDSERARIEGEGSDWLDGFLRQAGGDHELAYGLMTLELVRDMAKDFGLSEGVILRAMMDHVPGPEGRARMQHAVRRARAHTQPERKKTS